MSNSATSRFQKANGLAFTTTMTKSQFTVGFVQGMLTSMKYCAATSTAKQRWQKVWLHVGTTRSVLRVLQIQHS